MSPENRYYGRPGSDQTPDMLLGLPSIHNEPGCKECTFLIGHRVVEDYLKCSRLLSYGFCKIHHYILPGSQKTPESIRRVKAQLIELCHTKTNLKTFAMTSESEIPVNF